MDSRGSLLPGSFFCMSPDPLGSKSVPLTLLSLTSILDRQFTLGLESTFFAGSPSPREKYGSYPNRLRPVKDLCGYGNITRG